jgi:hypothetical protein
MSLRRNPQPKQENTMKKEENRNLTTENKAQNTEARARLEVKESTAGALVVSEFERAPLTDVNFGF